MHGWQATNVLERLSRPSGSAKCVMGAPIGRTGILARPEPSRTPLARHRPPLLDRRRGGGAAVAAGLECLAVADLPEPGAGAGGVGRFRRRVGVPASPGRGRGRCWAALAAVALAAAWSWGPGALPSTLALSAIGLLAAAALVAAGGAGAGARADAQELFAAFCWGWLLAGVLNVAVARWSRSSCPTCADGDWIARSGLPGRAVGNLRQPNHLSSLLLWACIAAVALIELRRLGRRAGAAALAALVSRWC